jgi:NRPS condensation-like uncharacterized protein
MSTTHASNGADSAGVTATAFGISYAVTALFNVLLVILKESFPSVHDAMAAITGHHWVTHGLADIVVFVVLGLIFMRTSVAKMPATSLVNYIIASTVVSGLILVGFFTVA